MTEETKEKIKSIKQSFRLMMNGVASHSMRERGLEYKINWGVSLPMLKEEAKKYGKDYDLSVELWKEDIRECKIMATMIMPPEKMSADLVSIWMEQTHTQEMAEIVSMNLYQHLAFAPVLAFEWMASNDFIHQICAYNILGRLFAKKQEPNERGINEFLDQVSVVLQGDNLSIKHAAYSCLKQFSSLHEEYEIIAKKALKPFNLDIL